jgi:plastocyanin
MKRLRLSILCAGAVVALGVATYLAAASNQHGGNAHVGAARADSGPLSNATVSFGAWMTPLDRFPNALPPPSANHHVVLPQVAKIKAGGAVNFIIAGLHQVIVYDDGTKPEDIDTSQLLPLPMLPPLIDDADGRIYRGPDPRVLLPVLDRVEVVHFAEPGTYLVICGVLPHFQEGMYGYVQVVP